MGILLTIRNSLLGYSDAYGEVSNPLQKSFDWSRQFLNIPVRSASSDSARIPPGGSVVLFDGVRALPQGLDEGHTELSLSLLDARKSTYRLKIEDGDGAFRDERSLGLDDASEITVSISNNALATFTLDGNGDFSTAQVGDILRIKGHQTGDTENVVFSPINSGYWVVLSASSDTITARRAPGKCFEGVGETVVIGADDLENQFRIYSSDGVQIGDSMVIAGTFSSISHKDFEVLQVGPDFIDFMSATPLPLEGPLVLDSLSDLLFYTDAKKLVYIETDKKAVVKYNNQSDSNNIIEPIIVGSERQPGFSMKYGHAYKCVVENMSETDPMNIKWILSE